MSEFLLLESMRELPQPADPRRVALGLERWREQAAASGDPSSENSAPSVVMR